MWEKQKVIGYGTGPKKKSEHFCYINLYKSYINLGFNYGSELPDPSKLLEGPGRLFMHTKIKHKDDIYNPELRKLIQFATTHRVPPVQM